MSSHDSPIDVSGSRWSENRKDFHDPIRPHPMFPLSEDQPEETRRIYYIHIWRRNEQTGIPERCPRRFTAEETREKGWELIISKYGRGFYRAEGLSSMCVKQAYSRAADGSEWEYFAGPDPKPFFSSEQGETPRFGVSQPSANAPTTATPPSADQGMNWLAFLSAERERSDRAIERAERLAEAERDRNARFVEALILNRGDAQSSSLKEFLILSQKQNEMAQKQAEAERERSARFMEALVTTRADAQSSGVKEFLALAQKQAESERERSAKMMELLVSQRTGSPLAGVKEVLELSRALPRQGGLSELKENLDLLETLGIGVRRDAVNGAGGGGQDADASLAKELISTVQGVLNGAKDVPAANAPATSAAPAKELEPNATTEAEKPKAAKSVTIFIHGIGEVTMDESRFLAMMEARRAAQGAQEQAPPSRPAQASPQAAPEGMAIIETLAKQMAQMQAQMMELAKRQAELAALLLPQKDLVSKAEPESKPSPKTEPVVLEISTGEPANDQAIQDLIAAIEAPFEEGPEEAAEAAQSALEPVRQAEPAQSEKAAQSAPQAAPMAEAMPSGEGEEREDEEATPPSRNQIPLEERPPLITPPPSVLSEDDIAKILSQPEVIELLPPGLQAHTDAIIRELQERHRAKSTVKSA